MLRLVCLAVCLAVGHGQTPFFPGTKPVCNRVATAGGNNLMPHEKFCQVFYSCDLKGNAYQTVCPNVEGYFASLFAFGEGIGTCSAYGNSKYSCPNWPSTQNDLNSNRAYPDVCCNKYWQVTAVGKFEQKLCSGTQKFDTTRGTCRDLIGNEPAFCTETSTADQPNFCYRDPIVSKEAGQCSNTAVPNEPCFYRTVGWAEKRRCPAGTQFSVATCGCGSHSEGCSDSGLTIAQLQIQKHPDSQCRASGRMSFQLGDLTVNTFNNVQTSIPAVFSDKLGNSARNPQGKVDHYFSYSGVDYTTIPGRATFNGANSYLYDFYYVGNQLYARTVIAMTFGFDGSTIQSGTTYTLLENVYYGVQNDGSNDIDPLTNGIKDGTQSTIGTRDQAYCNEATIQITATYNGDSGGITGRRLWRFTITARGERIAAGTSFTRSSGFLTAQTSAEITSNSATDEFRIIWVFNQGVLSGSVQNRGTNGSNGNGASVTMPATANPSWTQLGTNKCGFTIGRNLRGYVSEFKVFENCGNPASNSVLNA